jgi:hypothetical protein
MTESSAVVQYTTEKPASSEARSDRLWGREPEDEWGTLSSFDEAVEAEIDEIDERDELPATVEVNAWRRAVPDPKRLAGYPLELVLERLDEEYAYPDDVDTEPTDAMKAAEKAFIARVVELYEPDAFEISEVVTVDVGEWLAGRSTA